jgi:hypothetical protein
VARIAVLWHARQPRDRLQEYAIGHMADVWRADGHDVVNMFGTRDALPADVVLLHVDLSVVPQGYLDFAAQYPIALNTRVHDIRKRVYSQLRVRRGDAYDGPVIVKTQRNHGGRPEQKLRPLQWLRDEATPLQRRRARKRIKEELPYQVFDRLSDVPLRYFVERRWIVERFLPEREGERHYIHHLYVFGRQFTSHRMSAVGPIVAGPKVEVEDVEPHPKAFAFVEQMCLDYGKVDYVVHDDEAFLLDVNKTIGAITFPVNPNLVAARVRRAPGIYDYLDPTDPMAPRATNGRASVAPVRMQPAFQHEP